MVGARLFILDNNLLYLYFIYDASTNHENRITALESGGGNEWIQLSVNPAFRDRLDVYANSAGTMIKVIYEATYTGSESMRLTEHSSSGPNFPYKWSADQGTQIVQLRSQIPITSTDNYVKYLSNATKAYEFETSYYLYKFRFILAVQNNYIGIMFQAVDLDDSNYADIYGASISRSIRSSLNGTYYMTL